MGHIRLPSNGGEHHVCGRFTDKEDDKQSGRHPDATHSELAMKPRFMRVLSTDSGRLAILAVCIAIPVMGGMFLCDSLLMKMLSENAQNTSSAWVSRILGR